MHSVVWLKFNRQRAFSNNGLQCLYRYQNRINVFQQYRPTPAIAQNSRKLIYTIVMSSMSVDNDPDQKCVVPLKRANHDERGNRSSRV